MKKIFVFALIATLIVCVGQASAFLNTSKFIGYFPLNNTQADFSGAGKFTPPGALTNYVNNCFQGSTCLAPSSVAQYAYSGTLAPNYTISGWFNTSSNAVQLFWEWNPPGALSQAVYVNNFQVTDNGGVGVIYNTAANQMNFYSIACGANGNENVYVNGTSVINASGSTFCASLSSPTLGLFRSTSPNQYQLIGTSLNISIANYTLNQSDEVTLFNQGGNPFVYGPSFALNIYSPQNITYYGNSTPQFLNYSFSSNTFATANCTYFTGGVQVNSTIATNGTLMQFPILNYTAYPPADDASLTCMNGSNGGSSSVYYHMFYGLNVSVVNAGNLSYLPDFNLTAYNLTFSNTTNHINQNFLWEWYYIPFGNITLNASAIQFVPGAMFETPIFNYSSNTTFQNVTLGLWPNIGFLATNTTSGLNIKNFNIIVSGGGANQTCTATNSLVCYISLQQLMGYNQVTVVANGFSTISFPQVFNGTSYGNYSFNMFSAILNISAFDVQTLLPLTFNVTISNSTQSVSFNSQTNPLILNAAQVPTGQLTLIFMNQSGGYPQVTYFTTFNNNTAANVTAYLINQNIAHQVTFRVISGVLGANLQGALVTVETQINGQYQLVGEGITGTDGGAAFWLNPSVFYQVNASYQGFGSFGNLIQASQSIYTIAITIPQTLNYSYSFNNTIFNLVPTRILYLPIENITWSVQTIVSNATITWYSLNLSYWNGTSFFFSNQTSPASGGSILYSLNTSNFLTILNQTNVTANGAFSIQGFPGSFTYTYVYQVGNYQSFSGGVAGAGNALAGAGLSPITLFLFAVIIALLVAGWVTHHSSTMAGGGAGLLILGLFSYVGWVDIRLFVIALIGLLGIAAFQKGIVR